MAIGPCPDPDPDTGRERDRDRDRDPYADRRRRRAQSIDNNAEFGKPKGKNQKIFKSKSKDSKRKHMLYVAQRRNRERNAKRAEAVAQ